MRSVGWQGIIHWQCAVKDNIYFLVKVISFVLVCERVRDRKAGEEEEDRDVMHAEQND